MPILDWLDRDKDVKAADAVPYRLLESANLRIQEATLTGEAEPVGAGHQHTH